MVCFTLFVRPNGSRSVQKALTVTQKVLKALSPAWPVRLRPRACLEHQRQRPPVWASLHELEDGSCYHLYRCGVLVIPSIQSLWLPHSGTSLCAWSGDTRARFSTVSRA